MTMTRKRSILRERRHAATAEAMLEAAERAMVKHGYEQATMQQIAAETGCAAGTFYLYFKNKQELFEALLIRRLKALYQASEAEMARAESPLEKIRLSVTAAIRYCQEHQPFLRVAFTAWPMRHQAIHERLEEIGWSEHGRFRRVMAGHLRQAQKRGLVRRDLAADVLIDFIDAVVFSFMERFSFCPGRRRVEEQARILWGLVVGGLVHEGCP